MQIQNRETGYKKINNATAFKGLPVAKIRLKNLPACDEITIIQLSKEDLPFLNKMFEKINLEKMYPNLPEKKDFNKWKDMIFGAISNIEFGAKGFLAARKNKPCAILSFSDINSNQGFYIDHAASWPLAPNEGTKGAGKSIFRHILGKGAEENKKLARLVPDKLTPRGKNCNDFYKEIGFSKNEKYFTTEITANEQTNGFKQSCEKLDKVMEYKKITDGTDTDLNSALNLDF
ncbi:TPA: hypothetical protein CPT85_08585 [Candidatus Gastranaerophilales bacterium HUM_21]|nr:MAG TPA: hypothetical protein CPT85_08585 [Candidatus Gastranaerophilales bacterium HUM_21]